MKTTRVIGFLTGLFIFLQLGAQDLALKDPSGAKEVTVSSLKWDMQHVELGDISFGTPAHVQFKFKNEGETPVVVEDIQTSCGCTAAKHSEEPILPGQSSTISVTFNAKKKGAFHKSVSVWTSAVNEPTVLKFSGVAR
jgi:hypothetical protein